MSIGGVLFDIDGVLVTSWQAVPGAADTLKYLDSKDIARAFLTNTTSKTREQIATALREVGLDVHSDEIVTAASLTADHLRENYPDARVVMINNGEIAGDMPGIEFVDETSEDPDVVVVGGAGPEFTHERLSRVYDWLCRGIPVVAMHRSLMWSTGAGLRIDTGMYLAGMEQASGHTAKAIGKPAPLGFRTASERMGVDPDDVVMVGDDLDNDVLAAQVVGMTGVLVRTGKFRQDVLDRRITDEFAMEPDHVIDSVADLPDVLS
ncbi:TIGR01458 family HAD-type hydrolase [Rhodococcus sp. 06-462-5]|uniref:HAD-IIA family hydrolase n=1 Tax=unclassified Rhodococcus (in: high G+C Gram-positive bacteria) TaxID=192944 RepID=UPI000B9BAB09|nr:MULTISPECIES: HAD-IIA family hydrolase [unclassified Rhodococcus (in: high G+C Gram-positive bacteria)]OZC78138.1 TIGR01458 family HAD-type hydrolase [Rhodococcus sp. 06-462-5]OZE59434.1 TIGR01458 family HAD-type hydrolase [Rhodococcus sp. 02-925g]